MRSGEYTARIITEMYLERIEKLDKQGPTINAVIELIGLWTSENDRS